MTTYHNLAHMKSATVPIVPTGAGAMRPAPTETGALDLSTFYWARATARSFFVRAILTFLYATGLLSFLAFLATINGTDHTKMYITALSVVINAVAAMHYRWISKIRAYHGPMWLTHHKSKGDDASTAWLPYNAWDGKTAVGVELMVDAIRHSDWLITMIFLTFKIYRLINKPFANYDGIFESVEAAAATAAIMILLGAYARFGTDEMWDTKYPITLASGIIAYLLSMLCLVLLLFDMGRAADGIMEGYFQRSFFYVWIGYPLVGLVGVGYRLGMKSCTKTEYHGAYPEELSLFKDLGFGLLDVWSKGVFAMWTAYSVFNEPLFQNAAAVPYVWVGAR